MVRVWGGIKTLLGVTLRGRGKRRVRGAGRPKAEGHPAFVFPPLQPGEFYNARTAVRLCFQRHAFSGIAPTKTAYQLVDSGKVMISKSVLHGRLSKFRRDRQEHGWNFAIANVVPFGRTRPPVNGQPQESVVHQAVAGLKLAVEWACLIENGDKSVEIRTHPLPGKYLSGAEEIFIHLITTASALSGAPVVPCRVTFVGCVKVTSDQLRSMYNAHRISATQLEDIIRQADEKGKDFYVWQIGRVVIHTDAERAQLARAMPRNKSVVWVPMPPAEDARTSEWEPKIGHGAARIEDARTRRTGVDIKGKVC